MKKSIFKLLALLLFSSVVLQSCSVEYRERHRKQVDEQHQHDRDHDHDHDYHN